MNNQFLFTFKSDITDVDRPLELNNPFSSDIPEIATIAAKEFQQFIATESNNWAYDFNVRPGKMFGILVVRKEDRSLCYLGAVSGRLDRNTVCEKFTPSIFDDATDDFYINKAMTEVTVIGNQIKEAQNSELVTQLKQQRSLKSKSIQNWLFENYKFQSTQGEIKNALQIFESTPKGYPPAAAGECAAPKLLQYAFIHRLRPIALAEFWWGNTLKGLQREHKSFYPACKDKCKPILEFMLDDNTLFQKIHL